jgi:hypothetical protein
VAHVCNPRYSGGRDQADRGSKSAQANSSERPYIEKPFTKIGLVEWVKAKALSSSPSTTKKKKTKFEVSLGCIVKPCLQKKKKKATKPGVVVHSCSSSYLGSGDLEA